MFINELFEADDPYTLVVTYPGRFQPFHLGHDEVYKKIQAMFRGGNVYVVTSNDQKDAKSPFSFSDKVQFMTALGVHQDRIIETNMMYALPEQFKNIANKVLFVTVVGEPDRDRLRQDSVLKRDNPKTGKRAGDPSYYKTFQKGEQMATADQHGYVLVMPEEKKFIKLTGKQVDVSHGTQTRDTWNQVRNNPTLRSEFLIQLYNRNDPELGRILDKIPTDNPVAIEPKPLGNKAKLQKVTQPKEPVDEGYYNKLDVERQEQGLLPVFEIGRYQNGRWVPTKQYNNYAQAQAHAQHIKNKYPSMEVGIKTQDGQVKLVGLKEEAAGVGVVRGGRDPRYMTATMGNQNAVTGATLGKEMRAFGLAGRKSPGGPTQQKKVKASIGQGIQEDLAWVRERLGESAVDQLAARHIEYINQDIAAIKERIATEKLSAEYVAKLKERIVALEKERAQLAWNPQ